jgi:hypothetical protein
VNFFQKVKLKIKNEVNLEGFHHQKWEKKKVEIAKFLHLVLIV